MNMKQTLCSFLLIPALLLSGCTVSKENPRLPPLSEEQILTDLCDANRDFHGTGLKISDYEIILRQEYPELGEQEVSVCYVAEHTEASYYGDMTLRYWYNDRGWIMEAAARNMDYYVAKQACSPELPQQALWEKYNSYDTEVTLLEQERTEDNETRFLYEVKGQENPVCSWTDQWEIFCSYDLHNGWQVSSAEGERTAEAWELCGHYVCNHENLSMTVELSRFELDLENWQFTAVLDYSMTSHISNDDIWGGPAMQKDVTYDSEAPVTVTGRMGQDNRYQVIEIGDLATLYFCGRMVSWDALGEGLGLWVLLKSNYLETYGSYWLERQSDFPGLCPSIP